MEPHREGADALPFPCKAFFNFQKGRLHFINRKRQNTILGRIKIIRLLIDDLEAGIAGSFCGMYDFRLFAKYTRVKKSSA